MRLPTEKDVLQVTLGYGNPTRRELHEGVPHWDGLLIAEVIDSCIDKYYIKAAYDDTAGVMTNRYKITFKGLKALRNE